MIGCSSLYAQASEIYTEGYFEYQQQDDSIVICYYFGKETEVTVPAMIAGNPVSTIASGAFTDCPEVTTIYLPDTVMTIESGAIGDGIRVVYNGNTYTPETENTPETEKAAQTPKVVESVSGGEAPASVPESSKGNIEEVEADLPEEYTTVKQADGTVKIYNAAGEEVILGENGEILTSTIEAEKETNNRLWMVFIVLIIAAGFVILILLKNKRTHKKMEA